MEASTIEPKDTVPPLTHPVLDLEKNLTPHIVRGPPKDDLWFFNPQRIAITFHSGCIDGVSSACYLYYYFNSIFCQHYAHKFEGLDFGSYLGYKDVEMEVLALKKNPPKKKKGGKGKKKGKPKGTKALEI